MERWLAAADEVLRAAQHRVQLLASCTPTNFQEEVERLTLDAERGRPLVPRWAHRAPPSLDPRSDLDQLAEALAGRGPLAQIYAAKARELWLEASLARSVGRPGFFELATRRFGRRDTHDDEADAMATAWIGTPVPREAATVPTDGPDPRSLASRMREVVGAHRLPFRVIETDRLAALAATGPDVIYVATGRQLTAEDVERTVMHEVRGHALPRFEARGRLGIFAIGTARGSDDQEGRALALERREGFLRGTRRLELARRHLACRTVRAGADLGDTVQHLVDRDTPVPDAVRIAARAHRGGGLGREAVYLPALLRVERLVEEAPALAAVLGWGQVSVDAAPLLADAG